MGLASNELSRVRFRSPRLVQSLGIEAGQSDLELSWHYGQDYYAPLSSQHLLGLYLLELVDRIQAPGGRPHPAGDLFGHLKPHSEERGDDAHRG